MPRTQETIRLFRRHGHGIEAVTEHFTLAQTLPDGSVIRSDGLGLWRLERRGKCGCSWKGQPPPEWDAAKAVEDVRVIRYEMEVDYA